MEPTDIESSLALRAGLRQASLGACGVEGNGGFPEDAEDAVRVVTEIELRAQESATKGVTKEGIVRAGDRARASF